MTDRRRWQEAGGAELGMSVNVSARQVMSKSFVAQLSDVLAAGTVRPDWLTLAITESVSLFRGGSLGG